MLIRKSKIKDLLQKVIEKAEKNKDEYWKNEIKNRIEKNESNILLDLKCKEAKINYEELIKESL